MNILKSLYNTIVFSFMLLGCQVIYAQTHVYSPEDIDVKVNGFNILSIYDYDTVVSKLGEPSKFLKSDKEQAKKKGFMTYEFQYGKSYIVFGGSNVSEVEIVNNSLSLNGVTIGDKASKVKKAFKYAESKLNRYVVYYGYYNISFEYGKDKKIKKIVCFIPM